MPALLNRGRAVQQVIGRECDALGRLLSADLPGEVRCAVSNRMHWDVLLQFIDAGSAGLPDLWRVRARDAMHEFRKGHGRDGDLDLPECPAHEHEQIFHALAFPFRCDDYA